MDGTLLRVVWISLGQQDWIQVYPRGIVTSYSC